MSCGLSEVNSMLAGAGALSAIGRSSLLDELQDGLHAMAQPLTILHGTLWTANTQADDQKARERSLDLSVHQVVRLSSLLGAMRDLLASAQQIAPQPIGDPAELLNEVHDEMAGSLAELGVTLSIVEMRLNPVETGDLEHTRRALRAVLRTMMLSAQEGARLEFRAFYTTSDLCLELANTNNGVEPWARPDRLNFSIARTNMADQNGAFSSDSWPFSLSLTLPVAADASPEGEAIPRSASLT